MVSLFCSVPLGSDPMEWVSPRLQWPNRRLGVPYKLSPSLSLWVRMKSPLQPACRLSQGVARCRHHHPFACPKLAGTT